ncbi:hypothetical protein RMATCC62417_11706 [Rhizopus microsporus]|nr:hypothetical protein RMATCC62417_11706 [Rhizopus microsporus]
MSYMYTQNTEKRHPAYNAYTWPPYDTYPRRAAESSSFNELGPATLPSGILKESSHQTVPDSSGFFNYIAYPEISDNSPASTSSDGQTPYLSDENTMESPPVMHHHPMNNRPYGAPSAFRSYNGNNSHMAIQRPPKIHRPPPRPSPSFHHLLNDDNAVSRIAYSFEFSQVTDVTIGWDPVEVRNGRRLVEFKIERELMKPSPQKHAVRQITVTYMTYPTKYYCDLISHGEGSKRKEIFTPLIISCIHWPQHENYFVTSFDLITIFKKLLDKEFEKPIINRMRRHLECLKPITVYPDRIETRDFFDKVVSYTLPKSASISKEFKVYPWSEIQVALIKLASKLREQSRLK